MMTRRLFAARLVALAFFSAALFAPLHAAELKYLAAGPPDAVALLAPPPVAGSVEDAADADMAFLIYSARTATERARGVDEITLTIFHFAPAIGPWFTPGKFPKTQALFLEVEAEAKEVTAVAKKHWERLRPYHAEPARFTDAIEHEVRTDYGYPSGHSTRGTTYALLLAEFFPDQRDALLAKGRDSGWLRIQGGVHYPTDVYAGRVLGQALARAFLASPKFQQDLAAARTELAAH
jgi:acid phosphatase (class A)